MCAESIIVTYLSSKMKFLAVLAVAVACASADVSQYKDEFAAPVVRSSYENSPDGSFAYAYETANGISAQANGALKNPAGEYPAQEVSGSFRYTAPDGTPVELSYLANENGFQPTGSHIPVSPPVPEAILRSLAYIAAHPPLVASVSSGTYQSSPTSAPYNFGTAGRVASSLG